jgi:plasmid stabilization system protein ParE
VRYDAEVFSAVRLLKTYRHRAGGLFGENDENLVHHDPPGKFFRGRLAAGGQGLPNGNIAQSPPIGLSSSVGDPTMPQGDKSKYTDKQARKADHIAESYEKRGVSEKEAERRAWATVNKDDGGGKEPGGSGRGKSTGHPAAHKGGKAGGEAAAKRPAAERSASARKAAATRKRNAEHGHPTHH